MDDNQRTESIESLIKNIDSGKTKLPEFQRDFVWDLDRSYDLFDSLVRNIFIGAIIYGKPSFEITVRDIDDRPRKSKGKRRESLKVHYIDENILKNKSLIDGFRIILDGQQRATSIYRALKGIDEVWYIAKNEEDLHDSIRDKEFAERTLEDMLERFSGQESVDQISVKLSDVYKKLIGEIKREDKIKELFSKSLFYKYNDLEKDKELFEFYFEKYLELFDKLVYLYVSEKLLSYYLLDMDTERFALFFERSNSKGIQLNFIDILAAKLYKGFNLRQHVENFAAENPQYDINKELVVRTIAYIVSSGSEVGKNYILKSLTHEHFKQYWDEVCKLYILTINFLYENCLILSQDWMPYENMLIPLMIFLKHIKGDFAALTEEQFEFIKFWYWASIFSQRYSNASNEVIIQDSKIFVHIANSNKITEKAYFTKFKPLIQSAEDLYTLNKKVNVMYKGVLNLINFYSLGLLDWKNGTSLTFNVSKLEDHHIYPIGYLEQRYRNNYEEIEGLIDCVANRALITKLMNRGISKTPPSKYINNLKKANSKINKCLESHLINPNIIDGGYDDHFTSFLKERSEKIFEIIKEEVIDKKQDIINKFYIEPETKKEVPVYTLSNGQRADATYNISTKLVFFDGEIDSVNSSARRAKAKLGSNDNIRVNGWKFWRYKDENGKEQYLENIKKTYDDIEL